MLSNGLDLYETMIYQTNWVQRHIHPIGGFGVWKREQRCLLTPEELGWQPGWWGMVHFHQYPSNTIQLAAVVTAIVYCI